MPTPNRLARRSRRTIVRATLLVSALTGVLFAMPSPAPAAPIDDLRAQAVQVEGQMNEIGAHLSALNESIKSNQYEIDKAKATIADSQAGIASAQAEVNRVLSLVRERAATVYRTAGLTGAGEFDTDIREQASRRKYANATSQRDDQLLDQLDQAKDDLASREDAAERLRAEVQGKQNALKAQQAEFASQQAELDRVSKGINGQIAEIVAQEQAARRAAEAAAAAAAKPPATNAKFSAANIPPASGRAGVAVAFAASEQGTPYCTAGKGPDCYDCSGLVQAAWGAAGVSMPGSSYSQFAAFPQIPMDQIQPGDLLFFSDLSHVGIYAGGGSVINATHTGDVVRVHPLSYYSKAVRPG